MDEYVLVDAISTFRVRYIVSKSELQSFSPDVVLSQDKMIEWAEDSVTCEDLDELSQRHLGEQIISSRIISQDEAMKIFDQDNEYLEDWSDKQKLDFIQNRKRKDL